MARRTLGGLVLLAAVVLVSCSTSDQAKVVSYDTVPERAEGQGTFDGPGGSDHGFGDVLGDLRPTLDDHWHAAYSVAVCDTFLEPFSDAVPDTSGIHTHRDGIIHIHPFTRSATGDGATLAAFGETIGATFAESSITLPDGQVLDSSGRCGGQPAKLVVATGDADDLDGDPFVYTHDFGAVRFDRDRMMISIALIPEGNDPPLPWSVDVLDELTDVAPS